ncbi:AAA family ATPase [Algoriphagus halophytocola]|uniref:AAA family ATPase n=1 Tax=Algoriphagus halophytocola TaxID=2991499 RepID=UPI0022DE8DA6|nr:AAA family ATPase [Algoriphagus sp. TR-M9]WBL43019.1 AAA family ATPase [Algoriphagus sp. TR-M9]
MSELKIKLNSKYKSFETGFTTLLNGDLIILSGINGAGKSQLLDIINGSSQRDIQDIAGMSDGQFIQIDRTMKLNGEEILTSNIEHLSFKNNILIPEVSKYSIYNTGQSVDNAYNQYKNGNLDPIRNVNYSNSCNRAISILEKEYGEYKPNFTEQEFKKALRKHGFEWRSNDQFTDFVGSLFYNYAMLIAQGQQNAGKVDGNAFDPTILGKAPWTELNELFKLLKIEYRFRSNYEVEHAELPEVPSLYLIDIDGNLIETEKRALKDLSDGEKTIISLCFNSIKGIEFEKKKIILLDEVDALLNPSLTESLFLVLGKYYLSKGIPVVLSTHSPATISLSPDCCSYYEVFKKQHFIPRIMEVNRNEYSELKKVNRVFYEEIENQEQRIKDLEKNIEFEKDVLIITEGKTDWRYLVGVLKFFHKKDEFLNIKEELFFKYGTHEDVKDKICGTTDFADMGESNLLKYLSTELSHRTADIGRRNKLLIGVFDSDTNIGIKNKPEYGINSFKISPEGISMEFLFTEEEIKIEISGKRLYIGDEFNDKTTRHFEKDLVLGQGSQKRAGKKEIIDSDVFDKGNENHALSKDAFSIAIFKGEVSISNTTLENFRHVFEKIDEILECSFQEGKKDLKTQ